MKRCPECRRDYYDETLSFCLDDGTPLVDGPRSDDSVTALFASVDLPSESATSTTDQTVILPSGSVPRPTSSAEYLVTEVRKNRRAIGICLAILLLAVVGLGYWFLKMRSAASESAPISSIAVLPFQNKSGDPNSEYLSDGLPESLIYRLSQLPNLKVSPTSSVIRYKGKDTDVAKIASELGVDAVMTGRLAQIGDNLTISVELVDVRHNTLLWGEQYDRKMSDLLATQREIATTITQKLQLKLTGDEKGITKKYTDSNEAYQLYLKGRYHFARRNRDDVNKAIESFQQAIKLDPNFALAYARIAEAYNQMPAYPYLPPQEAFPQAKAAATRALEIDPNLSEAHTALGNTLAAYDWNWAEAEREFKRALELDPNSPAAHFRYGQLYLGPIGRFADAIAEMNRGMELEPLDVNMAGTTAWWNSVAGQSDKAHELGKKSYDLDPNHPVARNCLSQIYLHKGMHLEALAFIDQSRQPGPNRQWELQNLGVAYAKLGRDTDAATVVSEFKNMSRTQYVMSYYIATIYAALGDRDKAFTELESAIQARDWRLLFIKGDPFLNPLRDDPRFGGLLKRMNLPEQSYETMP